jgi:hypothetical protein
MITDHASRSAAISACRQTFDFDGGLKALQKDFYLITVRRMVSLPSRLSRLGPANSKPDLTVIFFSLDLIASTLL